VRRIKQRYYKYTGQAKGMNRPITIHLCPKCKNYLANTDYYKYCMYCNWKYNPKKLLKEKIK